MKGRFPKRCACGAVHIDARQWNGLPDAKLWILPVDADDAPGPSEVLQLRRCGCGSHLSIEITKSEVLLGVAA